VSRRGKISELGDRPNDITQSAEQKEERVENEQNVGPLGAPSTYIVWQAQREKRQGKGLREDMKR